MKDFINIVIFSKDRGCQLDLLLRSIQVFFPVDDTINVLYTWSSEEYEKGYAITKERHSYCNWVVESSETLQYGSGFGAWVRQLIDPGRPYTVFFVDDNVFKEPFYLEKNERFLSFQKREDIACFSLRMHPRIRYCYTERKDSPPPKFVEPGVWSWRELPCDWGYIMSIDGTIFHTNDIFYLVHHLSYESPNWFEGRLAQHPINKPYAMCEDKSPIMNIPVNKVQTVNSNHCGNISAKLLNDNYLTGKILDLTPLVGFDNISCHQELSLTFME